MCQDLVFVNYGWRGLELNQKILLTKYFNDSLPLAVWEGGDGERGGGGGGGGEVR